MANGTLAASQIEMLSQSGTGITTITPPATNTNRAIAFPDASGTVATLGTTLTLATAVASTSGTSIDFTDIPAWVKRITVMFSGVSTNGTSIVQLQLGDSGGVETTGYSAGSGIIGTSSASGTTYAFGFGCGGALATNALSGTATITYMGSNLWSCQGILAFVTTSGVAMFGGVKTLSDTLDRIRITTVNGTDTFDAGTINIFYEG
jgi:hypothetical protein